MAQFPYNRLIRSFRIWIVRVCNRGSPRGTGTGNPRGSPMIFPRGIPREFFPRSPGKNMQNWSKCMKIFKFFLGKFYEKYRFSWKDDLKVDIKHLKNAYFFFKNLEKAVFISISFYLNFLLLITKNLRIFQKITNFSSEKCFLVTWYNFK